MVENPEEREHMNDPLETSVSPEQKLIILRAQMLTPIEIIRGFTGLMRKHYESNSEKPAEIMDWIDAIAKAAEKLKELRDELA